MKKQTAVEFLVEEITNSTMPARKAIEQAKAMEHEQMLKLISFIRMHNKMGKSANDLLQEFEIYKGGSNE